MRVLVVVALVSVAVGCRRKGGGPQPPELTLRPGVHQTNDVVRFYKDLPPDGVLVQVGNKVLTRTAFQESVAERLDIQRRSTPKMEKADEEGLERSANHFIFANFMARAAMLEEAKARGVTPNEDDLKAAEMMISDIARHLMVTREDLAKRYAGGETAISQRIREEAMLLAVMRDEFGSFFEISDAAAKSLQAELERLRDEAEATNQVFAARLGLVRERLVSGELLATDDKPAVQAALPEGVTFAGVVSTEAFNIDFPQTREALAKLKLGEWSPVVEVEETFEVYQLRDVVGHVDPDMAVYSFLKFSVPRDTGWEVPDLEQLRRDILRSRRKEKQVPWVQGLITKAGVLYPNGIRLFGQSKTVEEKSATGAKARGVMTQPGGRKR